jgi:outer membrane lipoprotein-sorting protein
VLGLNPAATIRQSVRRRGLPLKKTACLTALLGLSVLAFSLHLGADQTTGRWTSDSVLAMMDKSAADFHSLTADIEHIKYTDVVKDTSTETGQIFVRRDQKMRIEITKPDPRTILRSGDSLYVFTPKINRVEEYDLGKNRAMVDQYVLLGFGTKSQEVLRSYNVSLTAEEELDQRKTLVLELTPKSDDIRRQITKIEMWIDEASWLPIQQKFFEAAAGDYFLFHYTDMKKNLKISDSKFKQDWPKDVNRVKPRA